MRWAIVILLLFSVGNCVRVGKIQNYIVIGVMNNSLFNITEEQCICEMVKLNGFVSALNYFATNETCQLFSFDISSILIAFNLNSSFLFINQSTISITAISTNTQPRQQPQARLQQPCQARPPRQRQAQPPRQHQARLHQPRQARPPRLHQAQQPQARPRHPQLPQQHPPLPPRHHQHRLHHPQPPRQRPPLLPRHHQARPPQQRPPLPHRHHQAQPLRHHPLLPPQRHQVQPPRRRQAQPPRHQRAQLLQHLRRQQQLPPPSAAQLQVQ
ncbi:unnamed protein product [Adineta steineri]|uniref:Uncharacterized protein n=1 Tax=Adineta steineri TaxID=433720 RepID=A0A814P4J5_9BILA|nr:unnamed protein product [Adineta steineri]